MNMLTKPSAQTPRGMAQRLAAVSVSRFDSIAIFLLPRYPSGVTGEKHSLPATTSFGRLVVLFNESTRTAPPAPSSPPFVSPA